MKRWTHLLSGVAVAATVAYYAATVAVRHDQRTAPEGWKSHDDLGSTGSRLSQRAERPSECTDVSLVPHWDTTLDPVVAEPDYDPLDRLRRSGVI